MRLVVIGASGVIGSAVTDALNQRGHDVLRASRRGEVKVDIESTSSIKSMYETVGRIDGVVCCAGKGMFKSLTELTDAAIQLSVKSKLISQINLVRSGVTHVNDGGVFVLTAGEFSQRPIPGVPVLAMVNGALESFGRAAALDLPRHIRINVISPPFIKETAEKMNMKGGLSAVDNAKTYANVVEGKQNGEIIFSGDSTS